MTTLEREVAVAVPEQGRLVRVRDRLIEAGTLERVDA